MKLLFAISAIVLASQANARNNVMAQLRQLEHSHAEPVPKAQIDFKAPAKKVEPKVVAKDAAHVAPTVDNSAAAKIKAALIKKATEKADAAKAVAKKAEQKALDDNKKADHHAQQK